MEKSKRERVEYLPLLTPAECRRAAQSVQSLFPLWHRIQWPTGAIVPYFLLGHSAYLMKKEIRKYPKVSRYFQPILDENFGWIYRKLLKKLSQKLKAPVRFREDAGRPGFHILMPDRFFLGEVTDFHVDFDYQILRWPKKVNPLEVITFTMPVSKPSSGAAIDFIDLPYEEYAKWPEKKRLKKITGYPFERVEHQLGQLTLQSGRAFHRIACLKKYKKTDSPRMTLQGMAVRQGKEWVVFW